MTTTVHVQLDELDLHDDATLESLGSFDNAIFGHVDGVPLMTVFVEDDQPITSVVLEAARKLQNKLPSAHPSRVFLDLVSTAKIAHRVGVSREAVRKWTQTAGFPQHVSMVSADTRVWEWIDVTKWLFDTKGIEIDPELPSREHVDHINACLAKVPDHTTQAWTQTTTQLPIREVSMQALRADVVYPNSLTETAFVYVETLELAAAG